MNIIMMKIIQNKIKIKVSVPQRTKFMSYNELTVPPPEPQGGGQQKFYFSRFTTTCFIFEYCQNIQKKRFQ